MNMQFHESTVSFVRIMGNIMHESSKDFYLFLYAHYDFHTANNILS